MIVSSRDADKFAFTPLSFHDFSLISYVFINIHEYANYKI